MGSVQCISRRIVVFVQYLSIIVLNYFDGSSCRKKKMMTYLSIVVLNYFLQENDIIVIPPWDEWWESELKKDESNPHIALLPLHPDMRAKFNNTAAWEYAKCMLHKPYVYHKMIFSWIDIVSGNYLPPLDARGMILLIPSFEALCSKFFICLCAYFYRL